MLLAYFIANHIYSTTHAERLNTGNVNAFCVQHPPQTLTL